MRGQTENILKGRCNGGRGTFGYTLDPERKFHIDPLTSPFVLESFKKYDEGSTMKEIRDWLNENGIKNPVGGAFTYNSVEHMLKNRRYIGELKFRDVTAAYFEAVSWEIVPGTTYEKAILGKVDTSTPEYIAFEKRLYETVLERMGFREQLPRPSGRAQTDHATGKDNCKRGDAR